jgi:hypothetical protein
MNCDTVYKILPLYLSSELPGEERAALELHLRECAPCVARVRAESDLDNALRTAMLEETPDVSAVLGRVHARIAAPWWKRLPQLTVVRAASVAAVLALVMFVSIALPRLYVHQSQRNMALAAASDHYQDLVLQRHPDWERKPEEVARFMQTQFPQRKNLLSSITPEGAALEKVRLCNLRGTEYAHFVFKTGAVETSIFLLPNSVSSGASRPYQAAHLRNAEYGLDVAGFSSPGLAGIVVGQHDSVPAAQIADRLSTTL